MSSKKTGKALENTSKSGLPTFRGMNAKKKRARVHALSIRGFC